MLQQQWQNEIASLVGDFETADVARIEIIRDSILKFEHYRSEFLKAGLAGASPALGIANEIQPNTRIIDVLGSKAYQKPSPTSPTTTTAAAATAPATTPTAAAAATTSDPTPTSPPTSQAEETVGAYPSPYQNSPDVRSASVQSPSFTSSVAASPALNEHSHVSEVDAESDNDNSNASLSSKSSLGFLKFNIFRSKTRKSKKSSRKSNHSFPDSQLNRSISSNLMAASSSIRTTATVDTKDSESRDGTPVGVMPGEFPVTATASRQRGESLLSSQSSSKIAAAAAQSPVATQPAQIQGEVEPNGEADFAEWVLDKDEYDAGNGGDKTDSTGNTSRSLKHSIAKSPSLATNNRLSVINEVPDKADEGGGEECLETVAANQNQNVASENKPVAAFGADAWPEPNRQQMDADNSDPAFGTFDCVQFRDTNSPLHITNAASPVPAPVAAAAADLASPAKIQSPPPTAKAATATTSSDAVDLDSAFSVPTSLPRAATAANTGGSDDGFGADNAFMPSAAITAATKLKESPALGGSGNRHTRSASADVSRSPAIGNASNDSDSEGKDADDTDDDADAIDQAFRVKFSIREDTIKDNPDESKAALTRVTTLLRGAPTIRRRNRRDVRTMYVASNQEPTVGDIVGSAFDTQKKENPTAPKVEAHAVSEDTKEESGDAVNAEQNKAEASTENAVADAFGAFQITTDSPAEDVVTKHAFADNSAGSNDTDIKDEDDDIPLARAILPASHEAATSEQKEADLPQETAERTDDVNAAMAATSAPLDSDEPPVVAKSGSLTSLPVSHEPNDIASAQPSISEAPTVNRSITSAPAPVSRRRAPPPPPPPSGSGPQRSHSRSTSKKATPAAADAETSNAAASEHAAVVDVPGTQETNQANASSVVNEDQTSSQPAEADDTTEPADAQDTKASEDLTIAKSEPEQVAPEVAATQDNGDCVVPETVESGVSEPSQGANDNAQVPAANVSVSVDAGAGTGAGALQSQSTAAARPTRRGRRVEANGPLQVSMHVRETLDSDFNYVPIDRVIFTHKVTGEIVLNVQGAIEPLELAPLRLCVKKPEGARWVANPAVVVLDTAATESSADGCEWYRFVRPNLFAQLPADSSGRHQGLSVAVFKYQSTGSDLRTLPLKLRKVISCTDEGCSLMIFYEPNPKGVYAGDTIIGPAVLLNVNGKINTQASRPTAIWYKERNSLLWKLDDIDIPADIGQSSENDLIALSKTLVVKAHGEGKPTPGAVALKFEARKSKLVDVQVSIVRVAAGVQASASTVVVDGPESRLIKSGKCIFHFQDNEIDQDDAANEPAGSGHAALSAAGTAAAIGVAGIADGNGDAATESADEQNEEDDSNDADADSEMSDYTGAQNQGNPYRPYAESFGSKSGNAAGGIYDELRNPLEGLRNATADSQFASNPLALSGISSDINGLRLENLDSADLDMYTEHVDTAQAATELVKFAGYRYLATLAACPFNIAQTLLQVQYLPAAAKYALAEAQGQGSSSVSDERGGEVGEDDDDEAPDPDDPAYYDYLRARQTGSSAQYRAAARARVDHRGYIIPTQEKDAGGVKPGYHLDALPTSKFTVLRRIVTHPTEGFLSLFKGAFSQWAYDMLHLLLQPTLEGLLNEMLGLYDSAPMSTYIDSSAPSALTLVGSNVIVGWLLSPLELVRTRLMIQSASPIHRKYDGAFHALKTVAREEGGLSALYFSPFHLIPTLVKHTLDPVFRNLGSFALDRVAGIDPYEHPGTFALGGLIWKTISVAIMLPVETIRTRLQAQTRYAKRISSGSSQLSSSKSSAKDKQQAASFKEFRTCVPLSTVPYTGMANCAWRIFTEEGESLRQIKKRKTPANAQASPSSSDGNSKTQTVGSVGHYGLRGLYPGFTLQLVANVAIFGLGFIATEEIEDGF
ncbi:hypothetical protein GGI12_000488 [Dipsacomyces acuminosporus]|nr:hypothetical protein GGI12_000488 [Dipsacomyces acuminosporus]